MGNNRIAASRAAVNAEAIRQVRERNDEEIESLINDLQSKLNIELQDPERVKIYIYPYLRSKLNSAITSLTGMQGNAASRRDAIDSMGNYAVQLINDWNDNMERVEEHRNVDATSYLNRNLDGGKRKSRKSRKTVRKYRK